MSGNVEEKRKSSIFSIFSSSSRRSTSARSSMTLPTSVEPSPTDQLFPRADNRQSSGSQISASQFHIPNISTSRHPSSPATQSPEHTGSSSPSHHRSREKHILASPTLATFPSLDTQTRISSSIRPSNKFLSQMPLSLALRTATIANPLPVVRAPNSTVKIRRSFFGSSTKPAASPVNYEIDGRSTFALVHGAILRYHSGFNDDPDRQATPDNVHFLNSSSIVFVTDAIQGFKWVLEIRTRSKLNTIRSPIKKSKSAKNFRERKLAFTTWDVEDGVQAWFLIFETPSLMTEWMRDLRDSVTEVKERESRGEKSPGRTPKILAKSPGKRSAPEIIARRSSTTSSLNESLPSTPSSSSKSFTKRTSFVDSQRSSMIENTIDENHQSSATSSKAHLPTDEPVPVRRRQPSRQDIALTAFRISTHEGDLEDFVSPSLSDNITPELHITTPPNPESERSHSGTSRSPNPSHYSNKRASVVSVQSRMSSQSSGLRTKQSSPSASPQPHRHRRGLWRTISGESSATNISWRQLQNLPPPHPPPTGPLPVPPVQDNYITISTDGSSDMFAPQRESMVLGQHGSSPVYEMDTPTMYNCMHTPRSQTSPPMGDVSPDMMPLLGDRGASGPPRLLVA